MARPANEKAVRAVKSSTGTNKGNVEMIYNLQNIIVSKEKNSDFLHYFGNTPVLNECIVNRVLDSGNYDIYYLDNVYEDQKNELRGNAKQWL